MLICLFVGLVVCRLVFGWRLLCLGRLIGLVAWGLLLCCYGCGLWVDVAC